MRDALLIAIPAIVILWWLGIAFMEWRTGHPRLSAFAAVISASFALLMLTGCAVSFSHPTKTDAEFKQDSYDCEKDAAPVRDGDQWRRMTRLCMETKGWKKEGW